jgi:ATP-binding cassette, subfamily G (WHITE), member 2, SNQ2
MGFGKGAAGTNGTGFILLVVLFIELFAVSLGQLFASISPSIQVRGARFFAIVTF